MTDHTSNNGNANNSKSHQQDDGDDDDITDNNSSNSRKRQKLTQPPTTPPHQSDEHERPSSSNNNSNDAWDAIRQFLFAPIQSANENEDYDDPNTAITKNPSSSHPSSLQQAKAFWEQHGFRTSMVSYPRPGLSIYYKAESRVKSNNAATAAAATRRDETTSITLESTTSTTTHDALRAMLGWHAHQEQLEQFYDQRLRDWHALQWYCQRFLHVESPNDLAWSLRELAAQTARDCQTVLLLQQQDKDNNDNKDDGNRRRINESTTTTIAPTTTTTSTVDEKRVQLDEIARRVGGFRTEQLQHEWDRIVQGHVSSLCNALWHRYVEIMTIQMQPMQRGKRPKQHGEPAFGIADIVFKPNPHNPRVTIYFGHGSAAVDKKNQNASPCCILLPSLSTVVTRGVDAVVHDMVTLFWRVLLAQGYVAPQYLQNAISPELSQYFASGLLGGSNRHNSNNNSATTPVSLRAQFAPTYPMALYLWGTAGTGKSSLLRLFAGALERTIQTHVHPPFHVARVKQNLNKPMTTLELELELRPNNNDRSVMSIVQGRRMALKNLTPGAVVMGLEEMAIDDDNNRRDPNQKATCQLLSQRLSGKKGQYQDDDKRSSGGGMNGDACIIPIFTSNYPLEHGGGAALAKLDMFENLTSIEMTAITGGDFSRAYLEHCVEEWLPSSTTLGRRVTVVYQQQDSKHDNNRNNDTRRIVRQMRILAFHAKRMIQSMTMDENDDDDTTPPLVVSLDHSETHCRISCKAKVEKSLCLRVGDRGNLFPPDSAVFVAPRSAEMLEKLGSNPKLSSLHPSLSPFFVREFGSLLDYWLQSVLTPTVLVSTSRELTSVIIQSMESSSIANHASFILNVDASQCKMAKSLYDDTHAIDARPNLRDQILAAQRRPQQQMPTRGLIVVELLCPTADSQMMIRELIEDSPSMTAFSTSKSALYKTGLFFVVHVTGDISPEIESRASYVYNGK